MKNRFAKREELRLRIKRDVRCKDLLKPSKNGLYCCPMCHSGQKKHRTGAVQVNPNNTWYCHACGAHGDSIDLMMAVEHCDYNEVLRRMANRLSGGKNGNEYYA